MTESTNKSEIEVLEQLMLDVEESTRIPEDELQISVGSRDWTVETIALQIQQGNIDLNPAFQRRNAWQDDKRSKLIESLIWGAPIPQIVLAENKEKSRSWVVIDGKQRLLTIAGFLDPSIGYWKKPRLEGLTLFPELNGATAKTLATDERFIEAYRRLMNADVRCTLISNYESDNVLYEIFYRINTGSTQLSTQELRQVLCRGWFADWLIETTSTPQPLHKILKLDEPDVRLADAEILLRCISVGLFEKNYRGDMKDFLDGSMRNVTKHVAKNIIESEYADFNAGIMRLQEFFTPTEIGRKIVKGKLEGRFNRALFEVQVFYFSRLSVAEAKTICPEFKTQFIDWLDLNNSFIESIESTTKSIGRTSIRFSEFGNMFNNLFHTEIASPV